MHTYKTKKTLKALKKTPKHRKLPYQEFYFFEAESVGTAEVICQPAGSSDDNVGFTGELQRLRHHVCTENHRAELRPTER